MIATNRLRAVSIRLVQPGLQGMFRGWVLDDPTGPGLRYLGSYDGATTLVGVSEPHSLYRKDKSLMA
jgi:hypothetical protein